MIIVYLRSSSFSNWNFCQQQYYMKYVLGLEDIANQKAEQGTIVHKVLECLAGIKNEIQEDPNANSYEDDSIGVINFDKETWLKPRFLTQAEVKKTNEGRKNKDIYKSPCTIFDGHTRFGEELVESIFEESYKYYSEKSPHKWRPAHKRDCLNWTWMALDYKGGMYDPRKRKIVAQEPHFDIEIKRPDSEYEWTLPSGEKISGNLSIKGTIDLVTEAEPGIIEIVDWKTGSRVNWSDPKFGRKTYEKLCQDPQLMLYYYAAKQLFPEAKHVSLTIFFIRDGGPFTVVFEEEEMKDIEDMLVNRFREISASESPKLCDPKRSQKKCTAFCHFYKHKFSNEDEFDMCKTIHESIKKDGLDVTTAKYTKPGHSVGKYHAPGE